VKLRSRDAPFAGLQAGCAEATGGFSTLRVPTWRATSTSRCLEGLGCPSVSKSDPVDCCPGVLEGPLAIPKCLPSAEPLSKAGFGGVFSSNRLPVLHEVLATLSIGALVSLLPALSEHLRACRVVLYLPAAQHGRLASARRHTGVVEALAATAHLWTTRLASPCGHSCIVERASTGKG
jgi:hypothetical protein